MHIGEVIDGVCDDDIGWRPASGSTEPVHVADGLVRALQGSSFDPDYLHRLLVWWKKNGNIVVDEQRSSRTLMLDRDSPFGHLATSLQDFEKTRRYVSSRMSADRGLYSALEDTSVTLTCGRMATRDTNEGGLGEFAAFLLGGKNNGSLAGEVLRCISTTLPDEALTALECPVRLDEAKGNRGASKIGKARKQRHNREVFQAIRDAGGCLATHERQQSNRLQTLERAVRFACVAVHAHAQALASGGDLEKRPPGLVAIRGPRSSKLGIASERALERIYAGFEAWLAERVGKRLAAGQPLTGDEVLLAPSLDGRKVRAMLARITTAAGRHREPDKECVDARYDAFVAKLRELGDADPARVLGHTLVHCYASEYRTSGGPRPFLQGIGRRVGLLYPHFVGRVRDERVRPSLPVLDLLVRACVPAGEVVGLRVFLERLWTRFGLIVGGRRSGAWDDGAYLDRFGVPVEIDDLAANTEAFVDELALMGLARRYPDGVTFVGNGVGT
jgi:hypothetical protein